MLDKSGRVVRRPLCVFLGPFVPGQKVGGRLRTCTLGCFGGKVTRMEQCATCEYHVPLPGSGGRPPTTEAVVAPPAPEPPAPKKPPDACIHLGDPVGSVGCDSCGGNVQLKTFTCAVHGTCTIANKVGETACCRGCPDRAA